MGHQATIRHKVNILLFHNVQIKKKGEGGVLESVVKFLVSRQCSEMPIWMTAMQDFCWK